LFDIYQAIYDNNYSFNHFSNKFLFKLHIIGNINNFSKIIVPTYELITIILPQDSTY